MTHSRITREPCGSCINKPPDHFTVELESLLVSLASIGKTSLAWVLLKRSLEVVFS
jgi:hypothetical protein